MARMLLQGYNQRGCQNARPVVAPPLCRCRRSAAEQMHKSFVRRRPMRKRDRAGF